MKKMFMNKKAISNFFWLVISIFLVLLFFYTSGYTLYLKHNIPASVGCVTLSNINSGVDMFKEGKPTFRLLNGETRGGYKLQNCKWIVNSSDKVCYQQFCDSVSLI